MKKIVLKYTFLICVFLLNGMNHIHARSQQNTDGLKHCAIAILQPNSDDVTFNSFVHDKNEFFLKDKEEEEEDEHEKLSGRTYHSINGNYFILFFGLSKIHFYKITQPIAPIAPIESNERFCQKRYRYLEVFRI